MNNNQPSMSESSQTSPPVTPILPNRSIHNNGAEPALIDVTLLERERKVRKDAIHNSLVLAPLNFAAAIVVFARHIISLEMIVSVILNVSLTVYLFQKIQKDPNSLDGSIMDFVLLSFAVIIPLSNTIQMAFKRRDEALYNMASFRATVVEIFLAHAMWDWNQVPGSVTESGRTRSSVDWARHANNVLNELLAIAHELTRFLTLPSSTRARHRSLTYFEAEARQTQAVADEFHKSIVYRISTVGDYCEILKREGIPGNEAARVRQWERFLVEYCEKLRMLKLYRTPQALRSFGRLFSMLLPALYCPFFAEMSYKLASLPFGIAFAVITSVALTGLFETVSQFEDPFAAEASVLDGIRVHQELVGNLTPQLLMLMEKYFPHAKASVHSDLQPEVGPLRTGVRFFGE
jgi:hypothetical protein